MTTHLFGDEEVAALVILTTKFQTSLTSVFSSALVKIMVYVYIAMPLE